MSVVINTTESLMKIFTVMHLPHRQPRKPDILGIRGLLLPISLCSKHIFINFNFIT